jgi:RNA polymerase sigma factor (sigma-70 family)
MWWVRAANPPSKGGNRVARHRSQNPRRRVYSGVESPVRESDAELLAAARSDPEAFGRFYDRYESAMVGYFMRRTRAPEVAADLTAEVFAQALASAGRYRPAAPTAAVWLFTIARNTLASSLRRGQVEARARRRIGVTMIELEEANLERLTAVEGERWVAEMLAALPVRQREAIQARVLDERDYTDIARELRTSELVVRKRVSRGLAKLRERIEGPR